MKLVYSSNGNEVKIGDNIQYRHHNASRFDPFETLIVTDIQKPRHGGSTGRVYTTGSGRNGSFPSVYGMEWIEREDQNY